LVHGYASALLDAAAALTNDWPARPPIDPDPKSPEISLGLRGAIRAMFTRGEAQTADWALAWYAASPDYGLRTPALRSLGEFILLIRQRFHACRKVAAGLGDALNLKHLPSLPSIG
jgi:hypothetical protein